MFTYAQMLRLFEIYQEVEKIVESIAFLDRVFWTLVSFVMILYVVRFVYNSKMRYRRLMVALRENRQLEHENVYLRGLPNAHPAALRQRQPQVQRGMLIGPPQIQNGPPQIQNGPPQIQNGPLPIPVPVAMLVPGAAQGVVNGPVERQVQ